MYSDCTRCGGTGYIRLGTADDFRWVYHWCGACRSDLLGPDGEWCIPQPFRVGGQADLCENYAEAALPRGDKVLRHPLAGRIAHIAWWRQMAALRDQVHRAAGKNGR